MPTVYRHDYDTPDWNEAERMLAALAWSDKDVVAASRDIIHQRANVQRISERDGSAARVYTGSLDTYVHVWRFGDREFHVITGTRANADEWFAGWARNYVAREEARDPHAYGANVDSVSFILQQGESSQFGTLDTNRIHVAMRTLMEHLEMRVHAGLEVDLTDVRIVRAQQVLKTEYDRRYAARRTKLG